MNTTPRTTPQFGDDTPLLDHPEELRAKADRDGFLFFKGLLPRETVLELRRQMLEVIDRFGWLDRSRPLMEACVDKAVLEAIDFSKAEIPHDVYLAIQKLELFHALPHHPALISLYKKLFDGAEVFPHPRNIARVMPPAETMPPTPPHQDFIHVQGNENTWTCWIPLGDVPRTLGGLSVLKGSHREGVISTARTRGAGGLETILCDTPHQWIEGDFEAGDVLTVHSLTVHKSIPRQEWEHMRLSVDYRFQPAHLDIEQKSLLPHLKIADWDIVYDGWESESLRYYWKNLDMEISPWSSKTKWQKEKIC